jgi:K+-sensing histidine kinase KdpD
MKIMGDDVLRDEYIAESNESFHISKVFITLLMLLVIIYLYNNNYYIFHQFIEVLSTTLASSLVIISITKDNTNCGNLLENIGVGFSLICIIDIIHILLFKYTNYFNEDIDINIYIWIIKNYFDYLIILISFYAKKRNMVKKKLLLIYMLIAIGISCILVVTYIFNKIINLIIIHRYFFVINGLILTCIFIIGLIIIIKDRKDKPKSQNYYILAYFIITYIYQLLMAKFFSEFTNRVENIIFIAHILKYIAYCILCEAMSEFVINRNYDSMYNKLLLTKKNNRYYNRKLNERMKVLMELNSMVNKSKNKYTELINTINDLILVFSNEELIYINKAVMKLLKIDENIKKYIKKTKFIEYIKANNKVIAEEDLCLEDKFYTDLTFVKDKGEEVDIELYITNFENNISLFFIKDVTERKKINTLKKDLVKYLQEEKLKSEFFSNISHELRTPINVIYSALQLKDVYLISKNYDGIKNNNDIIRQNCLRLIRTINNFIDANKLSDGYLSPDLMIYNIVEVVENVAQASFKYINKMGISLIFDSDEEEILVHCDIEFVERIILNLLSNCVKYGRKDAEISHQNSSRNYIFTRILFF